MADRLGPMRCDGSSGALLFCEGRGRGRGSSGKDRKGDELPPPLAASHGLDSEVERLFAGSTSGQVSRVFPFTGIYLGYQNRCPWVQAEVLPWCWYESLMTACGPGSIGDLREISAGQCRAPARCQRSSICTS